MTQYEINMAGTGVVLERMAHDEKRAIGLAMEIMEEEGINKNEIIIGNWDDYGTDEVGRKVERCLLWESEEHAENDNGARSYCYVCRLSELEE